MATIRAVFENGVFRPSAAVELSEGSVVELEVRPVLQPDLPEHQRRIYELLGQSFDTGETDLAARHDEREP
jgi:predicted DNA-binding antitoxin AbrB/MazE fold protein